MKATFVLSTLVSALLFAEAHSLKQASARDVAAHERFADLIARHPTPSTAPCVCPDGTPCKHSCGSDCGQNGQGQNQNRRSEKRDLWILETDFSGEVYPANVIAGLIKGDGVFTHTNGSTVTDWEYKINSEANRLTFWKNRRAGSGMLERIKRGFIQFSAPYLSKVIAIYFEDPDKVFMLSDNSGVKNKDVIRMAKHLLADKEQNEFMIWHHVIDRPTMEAVVSTLCPRLGPQYCEN
ncbi:hypothetical protein DACRYDRAFT_23092 [Dacryopinax primogenitus]|uniref:Uncharacterized protein n=1 Tax=Dacryopinax primogenitus (strain DJM 731) TaxID=1858805 RepID=M5FY64_DACPD|nr:uncharacterized protein DACRYDRAFT_23092 [Dacryopinax primogenitus]EJU00740.1 hypothetical protein DACRYDRAFT_23092 [Dacryopinax primogenitus]